MRAALAERHALADTLLAVGPEAPTLCTPWTTRDLAAHLVLRESRPDALPGILVPRLAQHTDKVQEQIAARDYEQLVSTVRQGPPGWWPTRLPFLDDQVNLLELLIHHEDILRAGDPHTPRRVHSATVQQEVWSRVTKLARVLFRKAPGGVVLVAPGHGRVVAHPAKGKPMVVLTGTPVELLLYGFGRGRVAEVVADGDPAAVAALAEAELGV